MIRPTLLVTGLTATLAVSAAAQTLNGPGIRVIDGSTGLPLHDARATLPVQGIVTVTDAQGFARLEGLSDALLSQPGCMVRVSAEGYGEARIACHVVAQPEAAMVHLAPERLRLSERVIVSARFDQAPEGPLPRTISVVDAAEIERTARRTTPEALEDLPGVFVQKTNHGGGSPIIRGLMGNQVLVLVDGIRLNNSTFRYGPNQYLSTVDAFGVDRIEVVRGSGSVQFGSDALGGVINVVTRPPELAAAGQRISGAAVARAVTDGMEQSARGEAAYAGSRVGLRGGVTVRRFGDLHAGGTLGVEAPSGYDEVAGDARLMWRVSTRGTFNAGWQHVHQADVPRFDQVRQRGFALWNFAPQVRQLAWGRYTQGLPSKWVQTASVTGSWQRSFERRERQARGSSLFVAEEDTVDSLGLLAEGQAAPLKHLSVRYGLDVYRDHIGSRREDRELSSGVWRARRGLYPDGSTARSAELFAIATWSAGRLTLDGGARRTWSSARAADPTFGEISIGPSATTVSIAGAWDAGARFTLFGVAGQAFRAPNIDDVSTLGAFDFGVEVPSPDLVPERAVTVESGVRWTHPRLAVSTSVWRTSLADLIDRVRGTYDDLEFWEGQRVYRRANVGDAYLRGFEVETRAVVRDRLEASAFVAYAYGEQTATGQPMRRVPPLNGFFSLRWRGQRLDAEAAWRGAARQDRLASGDRDDHRMNPSGTPAWTVVELRGAYSFRPALLLVVRGGNLFDQPYRVHGSGVDGMGRHVSVSLRVGSR